MRIQPINPSECFELYFIKRFVVWIQPIIQSGCFEFTLLESLSCYSNQLSRLALCHNESLRSLIIWKTRTLDTVYVWKSFPADVSVQKEDSPNVKFVDCSSIAIKANSQREPSIYPNPTRDLISIETHYPDKYSIEIISLNGQKIYSSAMEGSSHQIDLSYFQKEVYFITIRSKYRITKRKILRL